MKVITTSDWHIGNFKGPEENGVNLRAEDTKRCLNALVERAAQEQPELVLVSGDIFNVGKTWSDRCCEEIITAIDVIESLAVVSEHVVVMRGTPNHDGSAQFKVLAVHFADIKNVHISVSPEVIQTEFADIAVLPGFEKGLFRAKFSGLGKEEENKALTQELSNIVLGLKAKCCNDRPSILMAHYTVPGCDAESGQTQLLLKSEPVLTAECLNSTNYDLIALGHIHKPQQLHNVQNAFYSGGINALNFKDEGQERGFWIHDFTYGNLYSTFVKTPYREFTTLNLNNDDIYGINNGNIDFVATQRWRGDIEEKIVRIHYRCSVENNKALNKAILERELLDDGAFMIWEILSEKVEEFSNHTELTNSMDPEINFKKYLEEKQFPEEKIQELILMARPIIAKAEASMTTAANNGTFEPIEIEVKNYRNYTEESFNFENISFCTINGQNGAGKSSLFMDALMDCLYEEPREGELTGWITNDDKGCKGAIIFTFRIGQKMFRVTRTRTLPAKDAKTQSSRATLNIAELVNGEWLDRSQEKQYGTQQKIINIIGMDSLTFKSCALIMQDQYGLFLQAKPEERVEVLGNLLGLGVYQIMEKIAQDKAKKNGTRNKELKQEIEIHNSMISSLGNPNEELVICRAELSSYEASLHAKAEERDRNRLLLANQQEAAERREKLLAAVSALQSKKNVTEQNKATQQAIIDSSTVILDIKPEIEVKVAEYNTLLEREITLARESAMYSTKKREIESLVRQAKVEEQNIAAIEEKITQKEAELSWAQPTDQDAVVREKAAEYDQQKKLLDKAYEKERSYRMVEQKLAQKKHSLQQISMQYEDDIKKLRLIEDELKKKAELLSNVKCVDISNAKCGFLVDAISAKKLLEEYPNKYSKRKKEYEEKVSPVNVEIANLKKQMVGINFEIGLVAEISKRVDELKFYEEQLEELHQRENQITLIKANLENLQLNIIEAKKRLDTIKIKCTETEQERDKYAKSFEEHVFVQKSIFTLKPWLEKEKQLPVAEERKATAISRILELSAEIENIDTEIVEKEAEADKEILAMSSIEELTGIVARMNADVDAINTLVKEKQIKVGALQQKLEQISKLKKENAVLQELQNKYAKEATDYDTLKVAFSQSGVPHQIIRSIIPQLTATSNAILGQMTGGKMGVEFRLERLQKNGKEKGALDIYIEEYGKTALPYLSKSGGEKVKSSLSVVLALTEIKSSSAGIQLGMLFIDEPPFLDFEGIQAYCDALETIRERYPDIKIMAITHDPTFKSRFPQSLDVVKTENGSKVIY